MSEQIETISKNQARKLVLLSQRLPSQKTKGTALDATQTAIEHLGYIQIDTISIIQRAHHHTFWNRNPRYKKSHLDQLVQGKKIFEYWSHAAAYLPIRDYRYSLPSKHSFQKGSHQHWASVDSKLLKSVKKRITEEGQLMARDFENGPKSMATWQSKPAKRALEMLFMQGELMITQRIKFQKVYDLTERALPENINLSLPSAEEQARYLIYSYLRANGLGQISEIVYLRKHVKKTVAKVIQEMTSSGELIKIKTGGELYYALPSALDILGKRLNRNKLIILSPFDNLIIQRKRTKTLFDFDYLLECYVPKQKRRHGYFVLPLLWNGNLIGRMDCKADRANHTLHIIQLFIEINLSTKDPLIDAFGSAVKQFMTFNDCQAINIHDVVPHQLKNKIKSHIDSLVAQ